MRNRVSHVMWVATVVVLQAVKRQEHVMFQESRPLLDAVQYAAHFPVDVQALRCDFYAGAGQKWLCGPVGTGMLYVAPAWQERLAPIGPTYMNASSGK